MTRGMPLAALVFVVLLTGYALVVVADQLVANQLDQYDTCVELARYNLDCWEEEE